jgi:hypothetical protein
MDPVSSPPRAGLSHRGIEGEDVQEASFVFLYGMTTMAIRTVGNTFDACLLFHCKTAEIKSLLLFLSLLLVLFYL